METKEKGNIKEPAGGIGLPATKTATPNEEPLAPALEISQLIANERNALSDEARQFLDAHLIANPSHALNERCFRQTQSFKPVTITFANLRANSKAFLTLQADQEAIWSDGGEGERLVGLSLSSRVDPVIYVRNFLFNAREMVLQTYKDCHEIQIGLYLRTDQRSIKGRVDLPPDASVTLQSNSDRSTVIGMSSFAIDLD
ncbi:hypothetical protein [Paraherbaspirillum soli]|uniref:Uncharacterized protein n=1 Tax=Paraherbaspirillum soli TaxID=631222 RepID=A0ABW0MF07_9BURK